ncbi:MAG: class I SAM-dependent methyltransferase [Myxococcales bacterium]|nr:MAG: class I SAM-dependent methyltransferase [Myxococcales bacterium]
MSTELKTLLLELAKLEYRFTTVTPDTHALVLSRRPGARSLRDVFGWNLPFEPSILPPGLWQALQGAGACEPLPNGSWRATVRVSTVGHLLFAHSAFPTVEADAVFFGPDSYRFVRAIRQLGATATRAVDVGCGSGVGGITLAHFGALSSPVVLADINARALALAGVNAELAHVPAEVIESDVLTGVDGRVDLVISNPPYLVDRGERAYRHGGGAHGEALSTRIVRESLARLDRDGGGSLLLYTGVAIVEGHDPFLASIREDLQQSRAKYSYEELDPDIFGSELAEPAYQDAERIAAVLLHARVGHDF